MRGRQKSKGFGLVIALITLAVTGILAAAAAAAMKTLLRDSIYQERLIQAQAIAESGVEDALARLAQDGSWREGFRGKACLDGYYDVALTTGPIPTVASTGYARALALFGRAHRSVQLRVLLLPIPQIMQGVLADDTLFFIAGQSSVDSYNSETDLDPREFGKNGDVLTNKNLYMIGKGPAVFGNATYRTGGNPPPGMVSGVVSKAASDFPLAAEDGAAYVKDNDDQTGIEPSAVYNPVRRRVFIPWNAVATIRSGVYYLNELVVDGILKVKLTDGPVVIFLNGALSLTGHFENPSRIPANVIVYGQGLGIGWTLAGQRPFYGVLHAPTRDLIISQGIYGAAVGRKISVIKGALHYDLSLQRPRSYATRMAPKSWSAGFARQ